MTDLADRIERADGPSRELDAEIAVASGQYRADRHRPGSFFKADQPNHSSLGVPAYTSSLDAAMSLVPEGWGEGKILWVGGECYVTLSRSHPENMEAKGEAATPAPALCAAALRAKEQDQRD